MKTHLKQEGAQTYFVVSDLNAIEVSGVQELGFLPYVDGFAKAYPSTTPHLEVFYHHFARSAEEMILQRTGARPVPWDHALQALLQRLAPYHLHWWLIGSAALAVRGIDVLPGDLDLAVDDAGALLLGEVLFDSLVAPVEDARGWISTWFGRAFLHSRIEWAGGIRRNVDEQDVTEFGPVAAGRLESISWHGYQIRVPPLEIQVEVRKRRELEDRTRKIEQVLLTLRGKPDISLSDSHETGES